MKRRIAVAAGVTSVGAVLLLSGCGGTGSKGGTTGDIKLTAADAVVKASEKTGKADTFKADLTATDSAKGGSVHATGQFRLRPTLQFNATLDNVSKGGQSLGGLSGQAIFTGDTLYAKVPQQFSQFVGGGKPWVKISVAQVQQQSGMDVKGIINQIQQVDPAEQTKMFTASKDVHKVGTESVDGTQTTHYQGTVTVKEALQQLNAQQRADAQKWLDKAANSDKKLNFDLWVDSDNLPRKMVTKGAGANGDTGTVTVLYRDYGKSFKVSPPPSDQVGDFSLQGLFGNKN
ncbi:hypothetical protein [Actinomadura rupiterrae]|uniref:hypothetical protein n=1 Tax=Actinomadura rupiterrae TaxID=559627 RepID=UPI0020A25AA6|nr:hypothetical protein [Actinomadura rupiterrae]MCP2343356.1 hypothetical protein [Actinomadura rupiterrae]